MVLAIGGARAILANATYFSQAGTASLVGRTPWSARDAFVPLFSPKHQVSATGEEPAGGPAADQGVRPTS